MSFIQLKGIADVQEPKHAPEGRYPLCITSAVLKDAKEGENKEKGKNILCILEIEDNPDKNYAHIFHYVALPRGTDPNKDQMMLLMAKRFFVQFGIPFEDGVELEQFVGCRSEGNLKVEEFPPGSGSMKNTLNLDRLPTEESA